VAGWATGRGGAGGGAAVVKDGFIREGSHPSLSVILLCLLSSLHARTPPRAQTRPHPHPHPLPACCAKAGLPIGCVSPPRASRTLPAQGRRCCFALPFFALARCCAGRLGAARGFVCELAGARGGRAADSGEREWEGMEGRHAHEPPLSLSLSLSVSPFTHPPHTHTRTASLPPLHTHPHTHALVSRARPHPTPPPSRLVEQHTHATLTHHFLC
jgi:hypothetical protein